MKKILKDNKYTIVAIIIFLVLLIVSYFVYSYMFPNNGTAIYGNRLKGIEKVQITDKQITTMKEKLKENDFVVSVTDNLSGRTYNVIITVNEETTINDAKALTALVIADMSEDQLAYYDYQVFIKNENEEKEGYPIIGYLNKESESFSYSQSK